MPEEHDQPKQPQPEAAGDNAQDRPARSAAEELASEALAAAQKAVADLDTDEADPTSRKAAEDALKAAQQAVTGIGRDAQAFDGVQPPNIPDLTPSGEGGVKIESGLDLLSDVNLNVKIELGRTRMYLEDVLKLGEGSVVELDKLAGDPVDIYVNDRLVARGEVLILNDNFCVRINEIIASGVRAAAVA